MVSEILAKKIKLIIFDVDGVLTNGQIIFGQDGEAMKVFHAQDGLGISLAHRAGLHTAIITGRTTEMVRRRGAELKIGDVYQGALDKVAALRELCTKYNITLAEIAYIGDDLNDLPVMVQVGLPCAPANAVPEVKATARYIATHSGGQGAVREILEMILKAQDKWEGLVTTYLTAGQHNDRQ
jgi:3-deoxy-D-manno-octulosonate 8-phosphate phosphatase (KDO 8-P phosphatase)